MDTGKGPGEDETAAVETGLEGGVFARGAFAVYILVIGAAMHREVKWNDRSRNGEEEG